VTVAHRKRSSPSAKLQRSNEQKQLAAEIWGEDAAMTQVPPGADFHVQIAPVPLTNTLPPLPQSQPMPLVNVPMYTPTQHPRPKASKQAIAVLVALATVLAALTTILILKPKKTAAPQKATVHFVVEPKDAKISVAGTPLTGDEIRLEAGAYAITIEQAGYKAWTRDLIVKAAEGQTVNVTLERERVAIAQPAKPEPEIEMPAAKKPPLPKKGSTEKKPPRPEVVEIKKPEEPVPPPKPVEPPPRPVEDPPPRPVEPARPAQPARTPVVAASAVTKLSGEIPKLSATGGESNGDATAKMCIDETGKVASVKIVKSTAAISQELQSALLSWRYKPYVNKDGDTRPACFVLQLRLVFKRAD
jgi:hypothetical protein